MALINLFSLIVLTGSRPIALVEERLLNFLTITFDYRLIHTAPISYVFLDYVNVIETFVSRMSRAGLCPGDLWHKRT